MKTYTAIADTHTRRNPPTTYQTTQANHSETTKTTARNHKCNWGILCVSGAGRQEAVTQGGRWFKWKFQASPAQSTLSLPLSLSLSPMFAQIKVEIVANSKNKTRKFSTHTHTYTESAQSWKRRLKF